MWPELGEQRGSLRASGWALGDQENKDPDRTVPSDGESKAPPSSSQAVFLDPGRGLRADRICSSPRTLILF